MSPEIHDLFSFKVLNKFWNIIFADGKKATGLEIYYVKRKLDLENYFVFNAILYLVDEN